MPNKDKNKDCKEKQSSKIEINKPDPVEECKKANPNNNAFSSVTDWKACAPKDNSKSSKCLKLDDCENKEAKEAAMKTVTSVRKRNLLFLTTITPDSRTIKS